MNSRLFGEDSTTTVKSCEAQLAKLDEETSRGTVINPNITQGLTGARRQAESALHQEMAGAIKLASEFWERLMGPQIEFILLTRRELSLETGPELSLKIDEEWFRQRRAGIITRAKERLAAVER